MFITLSYNYRMLQWHSFYVSDIKPLNGYYDNYCLNVIVTADTVDDYNEKYSDDHVDGNIIFHSLYKTGNL